MNNHVIYSFNGVEKEFMRVGSCELDGDNDKMLTKHYLPGVKSDI